MALFGSKKNTAAVVAEVPQAQSPARARDFSWVLINPRITEKATDMLAARAYVFNVNPKANKQEIGAAVRAIYKVTPAKIRVSTIRAKAINNARTGVRGVKPGGKKAYVYLKEGESINLI